MCHRADLSTRAIQANLNDLLPTTLRDRQDGQPIWAMANVP
jgi:hypothetical protein